MYEGVDDAIDDMAAKSPEDVKQMLCSCYGLHTSCREVQTFRQKRFRAAVGRQAFIAARCQPCEQ